ncbi:MAG: Zn-ribbon domain-containing OB-fold protein [Chloroflexota bacterium]
MVTKKPEAEATPTGPVPIIEGYFKVPAKPGQTSNLLGNKCKSCGEVFFPARVCCRKCSSEDMEPFTFPTVGKLYSFTTIRVKPPHTLMQVPYVVGLVEVEGGEKVKTLIDVKDQKELQIGMDVELVIDVIGKMVEQMGLIKPGQEVLGWKFRPVKK